METVIYKKSYSAPEIDRKEILRYAGVRGEVPEIETLVDECLAESLPSLSYNVCYTEVLKSELLSYLNVSSATLEERLLGCDRVILFAATVGIGIDRLISRYSLVAPTRALIMGAIGNERVEALCDVFCDELGRDGALAPRFSAGYGDLPLDVQRKLFSLLDCERKIGVSLNASLVMSPMKSVTALAGVYKK